jgi:hypothetical protein
MKYGFVLTDNLGNTYRKLATSFDEAEQKVVSENNLEENAIISIDRSNSLSSVSLN